MSLAYSTDMEHSEFKFSGKKALETKEPNEPKPVEEKKRLTPLEIQELGESIAASKQVNSPVVARK